MALRDRVQSYGGFLASMVVPNIGAFIAWGLITALFIPTGWAPNETYSKLVGPIIVNLLPILIGYTGGSVIYGHRGGVIGAVDTVITQSHCRICDVATTAGVATGVLARRLLV